MTNRSLRIGLVGAGNVSWHLTKAFLDQGFVVSGIWNRTFEKSLVFANDFSIKACHKIDELLPICDLIVVAVKDDVIPAIACALEGFEGIVVHTAGSVELAVLNSLTHTGIFYPLQTFTTQKEISFSHIPILIESDSDEVLKELKLIAEKLSKNVVVANSVERLKVHTAAVFVNNFTNLMYSIGNDILARSNLSSDILKPLIAETASKALSGNPLELQTGPARRHDYETINKHLKVLSSFDNYSEIYSLLSEQISNRYPNPNPKNTE